MKPRRSLVAALRRYLLNGLAVIGPLGITAVVLWWLFVRVDGLLGHWLDPLLGRSAPGAGALLLVVLLVLVGWIVDRTVGGRILRVGEALLNRLPLVRRLYGGSSRIVKAVIGEDKMAFREVVLFEYPKDGLWAYGLVTGRAPSSAREVLGDEGVTIYLPTAPNPMSGFLVVVARSKVIATDITSEEVFTYIVSAGSVSPGRAAELLETGEISVPDGPA
ncbi:MAG: DUF502 domain-containing protein [Gemmatimonadota bacterium]